MLPRVAAAVTAVWRKHCIQEGKNFTVLGLGAGLVAWMSHNAAAATDVNAHKDETQLALEKEWQNDLIPTLEQKPYVDEHGNVDMHARTLQIVRNIQRLLSNELEAIDGQPFLVEEYCRPGGGGVAMVLEGGAVIEKAGVHITCRESVLNESTMTTMTTQRRNLAKFSGRDKVPFFVASVSAIVHPRNPFAPTAHMNVRYFELGEPGEKIWWFGGGADLTPHYIFDQDAVEFHQKLKEACDKHDRSYYPKFKKQCDDYFYIKHRREHRGIGGIFFDDLNDKPVEQLAEFIHDVGLALVSAYIPIVKRRKDTPYTDKHREWQGLRHGRYAEFNLVYDRGTAHGLRQPNIRRINVEPILSSLPSTCLFTAYHTPDPGSAEAHTLDVLRGTRDWISESRQPNQSSAGGCSVM